MTEDCDNPEKTGAPAGLPGGADAPEPHAAGGISGRRRVLMLGAAAASTVVTIRPALASTTGSVMNCSIPIPDPDRHNKYISQTGELVPPGTSGAFPPAPRPVTAQEAKAMVKGQSPAGFNTQAREAYVNYIGKLQRGTVGFTCYASLVSRRDV